MPLSLSLLETRMYTHGDLLVFMVVCPLSFIIYLNLAHVLVSYVEQITALTYWVRYDGMTHTALLWIFLLTGHSSIK